VEALVRIIPRIALAVGAVAALSLTTSPVSADAANPTASGSITAGWDDYGYGYGYDDDHHGYGHPRYGYGDWRDESYGEYAGDGYYCKDCEDDMPLVCREERYSCRAPRDWTVHPAVVTTVSGV
jgi:hypothetical protein